MALRCLTQQFRPFVSTQSTKLNAPPCSRSSLHYLSQCIANDAFSSQIVSAQKIKLVYQMPKSPCLASSHNISHRTEGKPQLHVDKAPLRLMALGGSITYGQGSSDGNGYRNTLRQTLLSDGYSVDMVGSRKTGSMENNNHEGWRGFRIEQIMNKASKSVSIHMPNIYTINAGSNDCLQDFEIAYTGERMGAMLESLWTASPGSTIILSTLLMNANERTESRALYVNEQFKALAKNKFAERKRIVLVDMHDEDGPQHCELTDGTHPNDTGYNKMAKIWYKGIQEAVSKGFLKEPYSFQ